MGNGRWAVVLLVLAACGGDDSDLSASQSQIFIGEHGDVGGILTGWFYDPGISRLPPPADGSCAFDDNAFVTPCEAACGEDQGCDWDGTCVERSELVSVGTLTVTGTNAGMLDLTQGAGGTYDYFEQSILFDVAGRVEVSASGSDRFAAFEIGLDVPVGMFTVGGSGEGWPALVAGEDLVLTWEAPDPASRIRLRLLDDPARAQIWCDAADSGSLTVPGDLISAFLAAADWRDSSGGASSVVERYRETTVDTDDGHQVLLELERGRFFSAEPTSI